MPMLTDVEWAALVEHYRTWRAQRCACGCRCR